jgi:crotonobetaine/carnitine-CoA ligase
MTHWPDARCFADVWIASVRRAPDAPFLTFEAPDGAITTWTYGEFDDAVSSLAAALRAGGVGHGAAVHLALTNCPSFVAVWLAAARLGAWIVPSDPMGKTPELAEHISRTKPVIGFGASSRAADYHAAAGSMTVVDVDEASADLAALRAAVGPGGSDSATIEWPSLSLTDRAAVMFTSGTTGRPKGVEITQANYAFAGRIMAEASGMTAGDRCLVVLPLFHANAQYYSFSAAIWARASVALMPAFSASQFLTQAARHRATHASLFAAPIRMILARGATPVDGVALRHCWFAMNIGEDQHATLTDLFGCKPRQLYGMTETIPAVLSDEASDPNPATMGYVTPGCIVDIQSADGRSCGTGDVGEIVVGGDRGITLFAGYLDDPATTAASFRDGWFLTGDRARRDERGRFVFDGRRADVLKVSGENVSTVEVEQVLSSHPKVLEAAVVGQPDPIRDEVPVGFAVPNDPADPPTVDELMQWCAERLGKAKRPREITLVAELPRTSVGKIRKFLLKEPDAER